MGTKATLQTERRIGVFLSYATLGINTIVSIIYTRYMLRCLGQSEYGLYQLVGSLANYLSLLSFGLTGAYVRFYALYRNDKEGQGLSKLNGIYTIAFSIISILAVLFGIFMTINLPLFFKGTMTTEELLTGKIMMFLMTINAAITLPRTIFTSFISANEKFIFQRFLLLLYGLIHPLMCVVAMAKGGKATELVIISLFCTIWLTLSELIYSVKKLKFSIGFKNIRWVDFKEIFAFSSFILLNDIINQINWSLDKVILGAFSGTAAIAVYGIASQLNTYYLSLSTTISSVYAPEVNRIEANQVDSSTKDKMHSNIFMRVGKIQSYVIFLVITGYIFLGKQFISLWAGIGYEESYYVGLWLMIPVSIPLMQNIGIEIQRAKNLQRTRTMVYLSIAIGNVLLSIPLCKVYGAVGCAVGTAISLIIGNVLFMNWYYKKRLHLDIYKFWVSILRIMPALILPCVLGYFILAEVTITNYMQIGIWGLLYVVLYGISVFLFAMSKEEKRQCMVLIKKVTRKR